jgi:hypothetical protein
VFQICKEQGNDVKCSLCLIMQQGTEMYGRKEDVRKLGTHFLSNEIVNYFERIK